MQIRTLLSFNNKNCISFPKMPIEMHNQLSYLHTFKQRSKQNKKNHKKDMKTANVLDIYAGHNRSCCCCLFLLHPVAMVMVH